MRLLCFFALCLPLTGASAADSYFLRQHWSINARVDFLTCLGFLGGDPDSLAVVPSPVGLVLDVLSPTWKLSQRPPCVGGLSETSRPANKTAHWRSCWGS
jgi:hypothetical protein